MNDPDEFVGLFICFRALGRKVGGRKDDTSRRSFWDIVESAELCIYVGSKAES